MSKSVREMSVEGLRAEIAQARAAEALAEYQDALGSWIEARDAARERQRAAIEEWVRRRGLFVAAGGMSDE